MNDAMDRALEMISSQKEKEEQFRIRGGFLVAGLAVLLAIAALLGNNADQTVLQDSVDIADTYAFYQAKNVRQTTYALQVAELKLMLLGDPASLTAAQRETIDDTITRYNQTVARYESEPDPEDPTNPIKGEGKKELLAKAQWLELQRDAAEQSSVNYDFASVFLQIAIIVMSASLIVVSRPLLFLSLAFAAIGVVLILNGLFLVVPLPV